jgi:hypothetical protein
MEQFFARNEWAGPIIGFIVGVVLGSGALWQLLDYRIKRNAAALEQTKLEKDYYEKLYGIQNEVSSELIRYIQLRDRHFANRQDYQIQNEYNVLTTKLAAFIAQYNRLEVKLAILESRKVRWFVIPVPPLPPPNVRMVTEPDGKQFLVSDPLIPDPLQVRVSEDLKTIIESYRGQLVPSNEGKPRGSS